MITLWENIADHYKDNPAVAAYDLLNEPQGSYGHDGDAGDKSTWYNQAYKAIRSIDPDHIIIMEAPWHFGPENICSPSDYNWTNVIYEIHCYEWTNQDWNGMNNYINTTLAEMITWANNYNIPIFNGEFQVYGFMDLWTQYLTEVLPERAS